MESNGYDVAPAVVAAAFVTLPFLLDLVDFSVPFRVALPLWLFPIPVFLGTSYLVWHPSDVDVAPFTLVFMAAEMAARSESKPWVGLYTLIGGCSVMVIADIFGPYNQSFIWVIGITFGWVGGFLIWSLGRKTAELKAAQAELTESALTEERSRIAREVHDVIAHSLSVTMLHVTAARMALERGDRDADAADWLREAEEQGRKSLTEIRRTVGLLGPDESATAPPMPTAADIPELVRDFCGAGLDVTLNMEGNIEELPPAAALNLYRIVQESLTNAAKHSPGAKTDVWLNVTDDDIRLRVFNEGVNGHTAQRGTDGGRGLRGMAERAVLLNGNLVAGAELGGWMVFLAAPRPTA
jgi:signal transduction histidine kinase